METSKQIFDHTAPTTIKVVPPTGPSPLSTNRLRFLIFLSVVALLVIALFPVVVLRLAFVSSLVNPFRDQQAPASPPQEALALASAPAISGQQETRRGLVARLLQASRQPLSSSTGTWLSSTRSAAGSTPRAAGISSSAAAISDRIGTSGTSTDTESTLLAHIGTRALARTH